MTKGMSSLGLALLIAGLLPPAWIALGGGADVDLPGFRAAFYQTRGPCLALAASLLLGLAWPAGERRGRVARGLAFAALAFALGIIWSGGFRAEWISVRTSTGPGLAALFFVTIALLRGRSHFAAGRGAGIAATGLLLGALAVAGVWRSDRAELRSRLEAAPLRDAGPDVILLLVDTLRADALGFHGATPSPSPFLDALASRSVVFARTHAQAPWTVPSVSSLLSALYPSSFMRGTDDLEPITRDGEVRRLPDGLPWLPFRLRAAGYHTAGFQKNPLLREGTRFERGFDLYEWVRGDTAEHESGSQLADALLRWADVMADWREEGRPGSFFLFAQFMDPHIEYRPPEEFLSDLPGGYDGPVDGGTKSVRRVEKQEGGPTEADLAQLRGRYRAEVTYLDGELRRLHDGLAARGLWSDETIFVLVGDHGEQFYEHGQFMHGDVHRENLHVPLLLHAPGLAPRRVRAPVGLIDVTPTLLELLGLEPLPTAEGHSLLGLARGADEPARVTLTDGVRPEDARVTGPRYSLIRRGGVDHLYDLEADPAETRDLARREPEVLAALQQTLARHQGRTLPAGVAAGMEPTEVDDETRALLEALGYAE